MDERLQIAPSVCQQTDLSLQTPFEAIHQKLFQHWQWRRGLVSAASASLHYFGNISEPAQSLGSRLMINQRKKKSF